MVETLISGFWAGATWAWMAFWGPTIGYPIFLALLVLGIAVFILMAASP